MGKRIQWDQKKLVQIVQTVRAMERRPRKPWDEIARMYAAATGEVRATGSKATDAYNGVAREMGLDLYIFRRPSSEKPAALVPAPAAAITPAVHPSDRVAGALRGLVELVVDENDTVGNLKRQVAMLTRRVEVLEGTFEARVRGIVETMFK